MAEKEMPLPTVYNGEDKLAFLSGDLVDIGGEGGISVYVDKVQHNTREHADSDDVHDLTFWDRGNIIASVYVRPHVARRVIVEAERHGIETDER